MLFDGHSIDTCYGCGVCVAACPAKTLGLSLSKEGFYVPFVADRNSCTECGACNRVCAYVNKGVSRTANEISAYVMHSKEIDGTRSCSSGGIGFEVALLLLGKGYKACGVRYSVSRERAEHFIADSPEGYDDAKGSKYLQSYTVDAFLEFKRKSRWVVFGTPCEIDSLARWAKLCNRLGDFVLVDFFCHGVPSYFMWHRYAKEVRQKHGDQAITGVSFRDKRAGTGDETFTMRMQLEGGETYSSSNKNNDTFYRFYLGNECMNKPCYEGCKYKYTNSAADIRIGDLWSSRYPTNDRPLSAVLALTETGREVIRELQGRCVTQAESVDLVADGQMRTPLKTPALRDRVIDKLARGCSLGSVVRYIDTVRRFNRIKGLLKRVVLRGFS